METTIIGYVGPNIKIHFYIPKTTVSTIQTPRIEALIMGVACATLRLAVTSQPLAVCSNPDGRCASATGLLPEHSENNLKVHHA